VADPHRPPTSTPDHCISPDIARRAPAPPHTVGGGYSRGGAHGGEMLPPRFDAAAAVAPAAPAGAGAGEWGESGAPTSLAPDTKRETPHPSEAATRGQSPPPPRCVGVGCPVV
jgi:hypothetical protein